MGCSPCLSTRIRCSWRRPTALQPARRFTSRARHRRNTARSTEVTTCLRLRALFSPTSLAEGSPRRRKPMPVGSRSFLMIRIDRLVRRVRAKSPPILRHKPAKRKRILYRRYFVSLEVRRRNPTRLSRSRRRETRHEQDSGGVSSKRSPSDSFDPLRRTIACRRPRETGCAARGAITTTDAGGQFRDRREAGAYRGAARGSVHGPQGLSRGGASLQAADGSKSTESGLSEQARDCASPTGGPRAGPQVLRAGVEG